MSDLSERLFLSFLLHQTVGSMKTQSEGSRCQWDRLCFHSLYTRPPHCSSPLSLICCWGMFTLLLSCRWPSF